jgi:hypothetical protein
MKFDKLERLAEINDRLSDVLATLGLKARLHREDGELVVRFENGDGTLYSPVWLEFPRGRNPMSSWKRVELQVGDVRPIPIGDNGWVYNNDSGYIDGASYDGDIDEFFGLIEEALHDRGVLRSWPEDAKQTIDENFARSFEKLRNEIGHDATIACLRENEVESYNFADAAGRAVRIAFEGKDAVLYVDGTRESAVPVDAVDAMSRLIGGGNILRARGVGLTGSAS